MLASRTPIHRKQIILEDTGERRLPREGEWYTALVADPRPEDHAILREVKNDFTQRTPVRPAERHR